MEPELIPTTERLAAAAEALAQAVARLDQQHQQLAEKIDRIVATVDDTAESARLALEARVAELERANSELKAQAARSAEQRKTLPPLITSLLVKNGLDASTAIAPEVLDKTLAGLSVEQRIAVKAQMARAGLLE
jgi:ABC-type transporter Mla subunit MlaD